MTDNKAFILHEGPAYSLALNKENTHVVVAGRNGKITLDFIRFLNFSKNAIAVGRLGNVIKTQFSSIQGVPHRRKKFQRICQPAMWQNVECAEHIEYGCHLEPS